MEIAPGVHSLKQFQGGFVHGYLIDDGRDLTLVDTLYSSDGKIILDQIRRLGRAPTDLKRIVLTHAHRAHLGGVAALKAASGATVHCHEWEADIVAGERKQQCTSLRPMKPYVIWPLQVASYFGHHRPCQVDGVLRDGDRVGPLQVVHTPGHTPGHLAFYWPERRVLFAGDTIVTWPEFDVGWSGFMLNFRQNRASLHRMADLNPDVLAVGHGDAITSGGAARLRALIEKVERDARGG